MRKKIVAGNWKMNLDYNEGLSLFSEMINMINDKSYLPQASKASSGLISGSAHPLRASQDISRSRV